jgi:hypothetical protein
VKGKTEEGGQGARVETGSRTQVLIVATHYRWSLACTGAGWQVLTKKITEQKYKNITI